MMTKAWITERFSRHELWVLGQAERFPLFAIFFAATLWLWIIPVVPLFAIVAVAMQRMPLEGSIAAIFVGIGFCIVIFPWMLRWHLVCAALMFGQKRQAAELRVHLMDKLEIATRNIT